MINHCSVLDQILDQNAKCQEQHALFLVLDQSAKKFLVLIHMLDQSVKCQEVVSEFLFMTLSYFISGKWILLRNGVVNVFFVMLDQRNWTSECSSECSLLSVGMFSS